MRRTIFNKGSGMSDCPKITVIVAAYNASDTIGETLNSISEQSFELCNVEVILADDCSGDNTYKIMYEWYVSNIKTFSKIILLSIKENVGTVKNINRAIMQSHGAWIKIIAADDILHSTCLEAFWEEKDLYPQAKVLCGISEVFITNSDYEHRYHSEFYPTEKDRHRFKVSAAEQFKVLCNENFIYAPSAFLCGTYLRHLNGFDEQFIYLEDYPFWIKSCADGYPIRLLENKTPIVAYRISGKSVSNLKHDSEVSSRYRKDLELCQHKLMPSVGGELNKSIIIPSEMEIKLVCEVERRKFNKVVIYGAGSSIRVLINHLNLKGIDVLLILDNDDKKHGENIEKINVVNINYAVYSNEICFVINSISYKYEMVSSLYNKFGDVIKKEQIITNNSSLDM